MSRAALAGQLGGTRSLTVHTLTAPFAGVVRQVAVAAGAQVVEGGEIMMIEPSATR